MIKFFTVINFGSCSLQSARPVCMLQRVSNFNQTDKRSRFRSYRNCFFIELSICSARNISVFSIKFSYVFYNFFIFKYSTFAVMKFCLQFTPFIVQIRNGDQ